MQRFMHDSFFADTRSLEYEHILLRIVDRTPLYVRELFVELVYFFTHSSIDTGNYRSRR